MLPSGIALLILASVLHCWYAANAGTQRGYQAGAYMRFGRGLLFISILILIAAVIMIWNASSFAVAALAIILYFLLLPLFTMPIMKRVYPPAPPKAMSDAEWERVAGLRAPPRKYP